ncbi:MutT/NUDIX family protein [Corynebacterium pseudotuberculosis]|nr:MutT/NUDIX family protein [Corynebacterium pseudotuberculosis]
MSENEQSRLSSVNSTESTAPRRRRRTRSRRLGSDQTGRSSQSHRTAEGGRASATQQSEKKRADSQRNANAQASGEERASKSKKSSSRKTLTAALPAGRKLTRPTSPVNPVKTAPAQLHRGVLRNARRIKEQPHLRHTSLGIMNLALLDANDAQGQDSAPLSAPHPRPHPHWKISVADVAHKTLIGIKNSRASLRNQYQTSKINTRDETSAGGLVISGLAEAVDNNNNVDLSRIYVALIGRLDRRGRLLWSMPKGHVEPGEDKGKTAEREVWEETGIHGEVFADLGTIDYWFVSEGVRIHKTVHHHLLRYVDGDLNDEDPEVTEVSWIPADELIEHFAYADERKLARIAHDLIPEYAIKEKAEGRKTPR